MPPRRDVVCIMVVSHNFKELTDNLCAQLIAQTRGVEYRLHVVETGSKFEKCSGYATLWVKEKCRMTRGWNLLKQAADRQAAHEGFRFGAYQLLVNDCHLLPGEDLVATLYEDLCSRMMPGQIHPYQTDVMEHGRWLRRHGDGIRKEAFAEIVCPLIRAEAWDACGPDFLDDRFFYGWGLDYDMPHQLHAHGFRCYISDRVGCAHYSGTTYHNAGTTEEALSYEGFGHAARQNMRAVLAEKYGADWDLFLQQSVPADVDLRTLVDWMAHAEADFVAERRAQGRS